MPLECKSSALPLELNPLVHRFGESGYRSRYSPIFSLYPRELQLAMNVIIKKKKLENPGIDPGASRMQIERSTTWANPPCVLILLTNLLLVPSCLAICYDYNYKETKMGESGYRSRSLSNANRALYHLRQSPLGNDSIHQSFPYVLVRCN